MAFSAILRKSASSFVPLASRIIRVQRNHHCALFAALNRHTNTPQKPSLNSFVPVRNYSLAKTDESLLAVIDSELKNAQDSEDHERVGGIPDCLQFHYEDVLRQDLLLKMNIKNIHQIPKVTEVRIVPAVIDQATTKAGKLVMEITSGQKFTKSESGAGKSQPNVVVSNKDRGYVPDVVRPTTLQKSAMTNFLLRLLTVMSQSEEYKVKIRGNTIKFRVDKEIIDFSPELEDHLEIFENVRGGFNVYIATTCKTREETKLLWSGLLQKED